MNICDAMMTLNGEMENGALKMERMKARLAKLRQERVDARAVGFGRWMLEEIDREIAYQERKIEAASR